MDKPLTEEIMDIAQSHANLVRAGMQSEQERMRPAVRLLQRRYKEVMGEPKKASDTDTMLALAIENLLRAWSEGIANEYANAMTASDKLARQQGRPDHDYSTRGEKLT